MYAVHHRYYTPEIIEELQLQPLEPVASSLTGPANHHQRCLTITAMPSTLKLNATAFISPQNHPILIRTFSKPDENAIKYHYIAHTSLDIIEERGSS